MPGPTGKTRVVLIDDHEMARRGLEAMLQSADWIEVVAEAGDCEHGMAAAADGADIVLLDIQMPGVDGLTCLERLRAASPRVAVVIVTLHDDMRYVLEAIKRGAAGYLLKDATTADVIQTLRTVAEGRLAVEPQLLRQALAAREQPEDAEQSARQRAESFGLTDREQSILRHVAEGLTNKEIAGSLAIREDTVKKHVQNIIWKLRATDRTHAATLAIRLGVLDSEIAGPHDRA